MQAAVIGLGRMGRAMAERLVDAGFTLRVWNRTPARAADLNATVCATPAAAVRGAPLVLSALANDDAVRAATLGPDGILSALGPEAVHLGASTISYACAEELAHDHATAGRGYLSTPVLGRPDAARAGQLSILAGGDPALRRRAQPLFEALGKRLFTVDTAPRANLAKIMCNFMLAGVIELCAEAMALADKGGLGRGRALEILTGTLFGCPAVEGYGRRIVDEQYEPAGFALPLGLKDVGLALALGDTLHVPLPSASLARDHLLAALAAGHDHLDWSALATVVFAEAGLSPRD
jgi:3-hydroxyisobutyrate dehydrogenase-like beta-hydroxyacid dehydrogenase